MSYLKEIDGRYRLSLPYDQADSLHSQALIVTNQEYVTEELEKIVYDNPISSYQTEENWSPTHGVHVVEYFECDNCPENARIIEFFKETAKRLEDYPLLDEDNFSSFHPQLWMEQFEEMTKRYTRDDTENSFAYEFFRLTSDRIDKLAEEFDVYIYEEDPYSREEEWESLARSLGWN
jgi:hypothetical protein